MQQLCCIDRLVPFNPNAPEKMGSALGPASGRTVACDVVLAV
jgi:hypothetical protein